MSIITSNYGFMSFFDEKLNKEIEFYLQDVGLNMGKEVEKQYRSPFGTFFLLGPSKKNDLYEEKSRSIVAERPAPEAKDSEIQYYLCCDEKIVHIKSKKSKSKKEKYLCSKTMSSSCRLIDSDVDLKLLFERIPDAICGVCKEKKNGE